MLVRPYMSEAGYSHVSTLEKITVFGQHFDPHDAPKRPGLPEANILEWLQCMLLGLLQVLKLVGRGMACMYSLLAAPALPRLR